MKFKKYGIGLLLVGMVVVGMVATFSNVTVRGNKYEVVENERVASNGEINSVVNSIDVGTYEKLNAVVEDQTKTAYTVIDEKGLNAVEEAKVIALGKDLDLKLTFVDTGNLDKKLLESEGHTVIPNNQEVSSFLSNDKTKTVKISSGIRVMLLKNNGIVVVINNVEEIYKNKARLETEIKDLKSEGYIFKAIQ